MNPPLPFGSIPTRSRCHYCGNVIVVDIHVDDEVWLAVFREKEGTGYICINCFASRADEKLIDWAPHVCLVPASLAAHVRVQQQTLSSQGATP